MEETNKGNGTPDIPEIDLNTGTADEIELDANLPEGSGEDPYDLNYIGVKGKTLTKYDIWERKLLDFSLRNTLLNLSLRRRAVQFISFDVNRVEDHLQEGMEYRIAPKPEKEIEAEEGTGLRSSKRHEHLRELVSNDIEHNVLHTFLTEGETKTILKSIYRAARNAIEESGANSLFLAIGALRWYETERSTTPRQAPLLLIPVEMVYKKGNYHIRTREEEITLNITLMEFLRQSFDINIEGLNPLPVDDSGVDVTKIFATIRDGIKEQKRWEVEKECMLGIFSFSKFLMWNDVHSHREQLSENNIISSLIANRLTWKPDFTASDLREIDRTVAPAETAIPVAVDSSQMAAVIEGGAGNSFILYGPPGTGKSQTITNLIANALYHGKRVLFVAEKMAALSVVQSRLAKIGLDAFCLELHSNKSTKRHVLQQLEKALKVVHIQSPSDFARQADKIFERRKELLAYIEALHAVDPADGLSPYDCILRSESIEAEPMPGFKLDKAIDAFIATEGHKGIDELLGSKLPTVVKLVGQPSKHPLNGLNPDRSMLNDPSKTAREMIADSGLLEEYNKESDDLKKAANMRENLMRDNAPTILEENPEELQHEWRTAKAKWFIPRFFAKRKFVKKLRTHHPKLKSAEVDPLLEDLAEYRKRHTRIADMNGIILRRFDKKLNTDQVPDSEQLKEMTGRLEKWADNILELRDWIHWKEFCKELRENGMGCVETAMESIEMDPNAVNNAFQKALYLQKSNEKTARSEALSTFEGTLFDEKTAAYRRLADEFQQLTRKELYARLASRVPRVTDNVNSGSEIGLLNRNISNGGRGMSLRDLFDQLPTLMPRLCPVMLMSPMSVAQYIDLGADKFDLVVFDEASQMPTSEAVGAIARGKSLIVVGDPKQMPPTSFFSTTNVDEDEAYIDDMESILEDCRTLEIPSLQLSWHYRSRHESLIAFSNNEYYEGTLITFPSVDDKSTKVHFVPVTGHYDKGGRRSNQSEAEAIVDEIERRLRDDRLRKDSIGVISFSVAQQSLIEDLLQDRIERDNELQEAAASLYEPIFVKNLENAQGDERDVILFSIGYGPDKDGKISMNFGPLNNAGGERRLNVAVSRARKEMYVYSTLKAADIDLKRTKALGVVGLKHFLQYAETQTLPSTSTTQSNHESSQIANLIAAELEKHGYRATTNVGRSQFRVDVAVERKDQPGVFSLGILLDGYGYRDTKTTRDREVVQPSVLQGLDWKVMRVWSVDWLRNKQRVIDRILEKLSETEGDNPAEEEEPVAVFDVTKEKELEKETNAAKYSMYTPHPREIAHIPDSDLVRNIVAHEQPITFSLLCKRVSAVKGTSRVTPTLQKTLKEYIRRFHTDPSGTIWLSENDSRNYDTYRPNSGRDINDTPQVEIINVIMETVKEQLAIDEDALMLVAAKKMGFTRRGANVDAAFRNALESLKIIGRLENVGDKVRLKES